MKKLIPTLRSTARGLLLHPNRRFFAGHDVCRLRSHGARVQRVLTGEYDQPLSSRTLFDLAARYECSGMGIHRFRGQRSV